MTQKLFVMASKENCPYCAVMKPIFQEVVKEYAGLKNLAFGAYDVDSDGWELADKLGLEGVPGFVMCNEDASIVYEVNNMGLVDKTELAAMIINNIGKD